MSPLPIQLVFADTFGPFGLAVGGYADAGSAAGALAQAFATIVEVEARQGPTPTDPQFVYVAEVDAWYRWAPGSVATVDNWRVLSVTGGVAGRWLLDGDRLTLSPLGGGLDDWARLMSACAAMAYHGEVHLNAGTWECQTKQVTPNGTVLVGNPGVIINSTLVANPPGNVEDACPFFNAGGYTVPPAPTSSLTVAGAPGDISITVANGAAFALYTRIYLSDAIGAPAACSRSITNIVGNVITLDRPLLRPFSNGSDVTNVPTARDIVIRGNEMLVQGSGDRVVEFYIGWDCHVSDVRADVAMAYFAFGYDIASRDCVFEHCYVDGNNVTPAAFAAENAEACAIRDCSSTGCTAYNVVLPSCDGVIVEGGQHSDATQYGLLLTSNDAADTLGCRGCEIIGVTFSHCGTAGVGFDNGSSGNILDGVSVLYGTQVGFLFVPGSAAGVTRGNVLKGCYARGNATAIQATDGGDNLIEGFTTVDNTSGHAISVSNASKLHVNGCYIEQSVNDPGTNGKLVATGTGSLIQATDVTYLSTQTAGDSVLVEVQNDAIVEMGGRSVATFPVGLAGGNVIGFDVVNGRCRVNGYRQSGSGGVGTYGFLAATANGHVRVGKDVDVSSAGVGAFASGGGTFNRGQVALNGAVPVAVPFGDTLATDRFFSALAVAGGAPTGVLITGAPTAGVGFTIVGIAGDTSTYDYEIN